MVMLHKAFIFVVQNTRIIHSQLRLHAILILGKRKSNLEIIALMKTDFLFINHRTLCYLIW